MSVTGTALPIGSLDAIPLGEGRVFEVRGRRVAVFRCRNGEVHATGAECPHRGGPLADGILGEAAVICPLHGFVFDLRTGDARGRECARLVTYPVAVSPSGVVLVDL